MTLPTSKTLLDKAMNHVPSGRNNAGLWLAQQLHANGYTETDAENVMRSYAEAVGGGSGKHSYTAAEALATLRAEYKRTAKDPWGGAVGSRGVGSGPGSWQAIRTQRAFPTGPPKQEQRTDPESIAAFQAQCKGLKPFEGSTAEAYLISRGIPSELAIAAHCRYHSTWGRGTTKKKDGTTKTFAGIGPAVVFPLYSDKGVPVAASGRAINQTKHLNHLTYGQKIGGAFITPDALETDPVAITEAPIDALTLALAGLPTIALCGTSGLPSWLIKRLGTPSANTPPGHSRIVYLAFDNDTAGEQAAARIRTALPLVQTIRLRPTRKDWNEDLMQGGIEPLRDYLKAEGVEARTIEHTHFNVNASESSPSPALFDSEGDPDNPPTSCKQCGCKRFCYSAYVYNGLGGWICDKCAHLQ